MDRIKLLVVNNHLISFSVSVSKWIGFAVFIISCGSMFAQSANDSARSSTCNSARIKPFQIAKLPSVLQETSGLVVFDHTLWTLNDGGNPAEIYQIDTISGAVLRTVTIRGAVNTDWEGLTQDDSSIYIGDFGNNSGNRKDLYILKISKNDLISNRSDTLSAGYIRYIYPDQVDFSPDENHTNFDCEAFFFYNDSIHIFSKRWLDLNTSHYKVPADTGYFQAEFVELFQADGLITDASINDKGNIILLGYKNTGGKFWKCFCWTLADYDDCYFFDGAKTRIELGSALRIGQSEGIYLKNDNQVWLSSESIMKRGPFRKAKLFTMDLRTYFLKSHE